MKPRKRLNLGCGLDIRKGWVNLDSADLKGADVVHDLNKFPYPFKENTFDEVLIKHVLEHLPDTIKVMEEIYRISKPGAIVRIIVPYYNSRGAYSDPTHVKFFSPDCFLYFTEDHLNKYYSKARFKIIQNEKISTGRLISKMPFRDLLDLFLRNIYDEIHVTYRAVK